MRKFAAALAVLLALGCSKKNALSSDPAPLGDAEQPNAETAASDEIRPTACDAYEAWPYVPDGGSPNYAKFSAEIASWPSECRARSMAALCSEHGCVDEPASALISNAKTPSDARALRLIRRDANASELKIVQPLAKQVGAIVTYASSIKGAPRASAFRSGTSLEASANDLANGNPCRTRQIKDFARVDVVRESVDAHTKSDSEADYTDPLSYALMDSKSCLDCTDDRSSCASMSFRFQQATAAIAKLAVAVADDNAILAAPK